MIINMDKQDIIKEVTSIVHRELGSEYKVVLFGSQARGDAQERSDIDIGIRGPDKVPWATYLRIRDAVENIGTLRQIDVVDLNAVSDRFRNRAMREAIAL